MRKLFVTAAAVATLLATGTLTTRSDAMTPGAKAGARAAIETTRAVKAIKYVRWSRHHRHHRHFWMHRHHHRHVR